ncbi:mannosyltransferase [Apophysomyces sp. BC1034]|nr:mannosyltransferase [Apophysomyces sp. BC1015]KAG0182392.1 mannosyltransferase [Apophysomyces sp. BC1021]KAG0192850.1 mannosyltransferase [Apophysomyces sp. BC1034]
MPELRSRSNKKTKKGAKKADVAAAQAAQTRGANVQAAKAARDLLTESGTFSLSFNSAFRLLFIVRCASALYNIIHDCDEVYNYWEPLHYLQNGYGLQTWEYSPEFSIRSWAYIALHSIVSSVTSLLLSNKLQTFYLVRLSFAAFSSFAEARFYRTVVEEINPHVGRYILVALFFSAGMFNAATAFLPSTFSMYTTFMAFSYILRPPNHAERSRTYYAVFWLGLGALVGWPFSAVVGIPFAIEEVLVFGRDSVTKNGVVIQVMRTPNWRFKRAFRLAEAILVCAVGIAIPIILVDHYFYKQWSFVPLRIVMYNVFGGDSRGPSIFGTEPWYFYILNGFLNFNVIFLFALASAGCVLVTAYVDRQRVPGSTWLETTWPYILLGLKLVPFYIWFTIFTFQPHKEERFLYVAYPLVTLNAAIAIYLVRSWTSRVARALGASVEVRAAVIQYTSFAILTVFALISMSRIFAILTRYRAPVAVFGSLWKERAPDQLVNLDYIQENYPYDASMRELNLCVGKEWHRFPSNFFLPSDVRLQFIKSDFEGMLPKHFEEDLETVTYKESNETLTYRKRKFEFAGARQAQKGFNDKNKEDPSTYVDIESCDYLVDSDFPLRPISTREPRYLQDAKTWELLNCYPVMDPENSNRLSRAFWVPGSHGLAWGEYCLLKRRH